MTAKKESVKKADPVVETPVVETPVVETTKTEEPKSSSVPWGKIGPLGRGTMTDPSTGIRYTVNPVPIGKMPKEGSWLDCQVKANLITIIQGPAK